MKMTATLRQLFNKQINDEYYSAYLYLAMSGWLAENDFPGASKWMLVQYREELSHAEGLVQYMMLRDENIQLKAIDEPKQSWDSVLQVFEEALKHEESVTASINRLAAAAEKDGDRAALIFLDWYVLEQVEEENNGNENIRLWKTAVDNPMLQLRIDEMYAEREYHAPEIPYLE